MTRSKDDVPVTGPTVAGHHLGEPSATPQAAVDPAGATASWDPTMLLPASDRAMTPGGSIGSSSSSGALLRRIEQFVLLERLGAGGMGVVYAAYDEKLERKVAIKFVAQGNEARAQNRLLREAQAQARLSHPNVATVFEVGAVPGGGLFIAMELVKGQNLRAWQQSAPRNWREVLAMYSAAGQGLAAAHRAGIIHRDFKPDNIVVGEDGRVRVVDFGLAFATEAEVGAEAGASGASGSPESSGGTASSLSEASSSALRPVLTAAGAVMGTLGYMAPEQFAGAAVDARTDQFSFCVSFYEALHGERPFADRAFVSDQRPALRRTTHDPAHPRWLWSVLMRGLALDPGDRFATMDALLGELTKHHDRKRRRVTAIGVVVGALALIGVTALAVTERTSLPLCPRATDELAGIWDGASKQRIKVAVLGTGTNYAPTVWASTELTIDRYVDGWLKAQQAACMATHVRGVQSEALLDRRIGCLAGPRRSLVAVVDVLQNQSQKAVQNAGDLLASLGDFDRCSDTLLDAGPANVTSLPDPVQQAKLVELRNHLSRAGALLAAGDKEAAAAAVALAVEIEKPLNKDWVRAEIQYLQGQVQFANDKVAEAIVLYKQAIELAVASFHDELVADIWLTLALPVAVREQRPAQTADWLAHGESWIRRLNHVNDPRWIDIAHARGNLQLASGDNAKSLATLSGAIGAAEDRWGKSDPRLISLLRDRALVYARSGHATSATSAVADGERALTLAISAWGPEYPEIARTRRSLGYFYIDQVGEIERGEKQIKLAIELYSKQDADSTEVANCEQMLAWASTLRGDYASALTHAERAAQIYLLRAGADNTRYGQALVGLGGARQMRNDFAGALQANTDAHAILLNSFGAKHQKVGNLLSNMGEISLALGKTEEAQQNFQHALDILSARLNPDHADLAYPLKGLGQVYLARNRPQDALEPLERALSLCNSQAPVFPPHERAEVRWTLARVLRALHREPARALVLAREALAIYVKLGPQSAARAKEIERWVATLSK